MAVFIGVGPWCICYINPPLIIILWVVGRGSGWLGDSMNIENGLDLRWTASIRPAGRVRLDGQQSVGNRRHRLLVAVADFRILDDTQQTVDERANLHRTLTSPIERVLQFAISAFGARDCSYKRRKSPSARGPWETDVQASSNRNLASPLRIVWILRQEFG